MPHPPLHPAGSVESIAHALSRLTQRQNARKYAARRPVVSALKAASQPSPVSAQLLHKESSREQESKPEDGIDYDVIAANSNNSNSHSSVTPVPNYGAKINHMQEPLLSTTTRTQRSPLSSYTFLSAHDLPISRDPHKFHFAGSIRGCEDPSLLAGEHSVFITQVAPNSEIIPTNQDNTCSQLFTSSYLQSTIKGHSPCGSAFTQASSNGVGDSGVKYRHGTPGSPDLLKRIQTHNRAISQYMEMQRQHNLPHGHIRTQPTPTTSVHHTTSTPSFKFVVPHPPPTPKPNFVLGGHRGVIRTTPVTM